MLELGHEVADAKQGTIGAELHITLPGNKDREHALIRWGGTLMMSFEAPSAGVPELSATLSPKTSCSCRYSCIDTWGLSRSSLFMSQDAQALWLDPFDADNTQVSTQNLGSLFYQDDDDWADGSISIRAKVVHLVGSKPVKAGTRFIVCLGVNLTNSAFCDDYLALTTVEADWKVEGVSIRVG